MRDKYCSPASHTGHYASTGQRLEGLPAQPGRAVPQRGAVRLCLLRLRCRAAPLHRRPVRLPRISLHLRSGLPSASAPPFYLLLVVPRPKLYRQTNEQTMLHRRTSGLCRASRPAVGRLMGLVNSGCLGLVFLVVESVGVCRLALVVWHNQAQ